ncbi:MAG TPA: hypothetical protein VF498_15575 [Anaerolineales bacterium]
MESQAIPNITSFLIRFVEAESASPASEARAADSSGTANSAQPRSLAFRGTVTHIPSGQEVAFTRWEDAVHFIQRFVPFQLDA